MRLKIDITIKEPLYALVMSGHTSTISGMASHILSGTGSYLSDLESCMEVDVRAVDKNSILVGH